MRHYLAKISGRSLPQITRLIRCYRQSGTVKPSAPRRRHRFPTRYTRADIALLAAVDGAHEGLSGPALRHILWREYSVYNKAAYQRLASISASHIYNLRRPVPRCESFSPPATLSASSARAAGRYMA